MTKLRILSVLAQKRWFIHLVGCTSVLLLVWATSILGVFPQLRSASSAQMQHQQSQQLRLELAGLQQHRTELVGKILAMSSTLVEQYSLNDASDESVLDLLVRLSNEHGLAFMAYTEASLNLTEADADSSRRVSLPALHQLPTSVSGHRAFVRLQGSYLDLQQWLATLTRLPTPIQVQSLRLGAVDSSSDHYEAQAELHVFALPQYLKANHFD